MNGVDIRRIRFGGAGYNFMGRLVGILPAARRDGVTGRWLRRSITRFTERLGREIAAYRPDVVLTLPHLFTNVRSVLAIHSDTAFPLAMVPLLHEDDPYWPFEEMRAALERASAVMALTDHERTRLVDAYGVDPDLVFTCPGGITVPTGIVDAADRDPIVLFLGRKSAAKGIGRLVSAMRIVWQTMPGARLVLAGRPDPGFDSTGVVDALTAAERSRVDLVDDLSDAQRDELLRRAACLALPSTNESFGLVVLEAWAHATPVVVSDIPVLAETVSHGIDGLVVDPEHGPALAAALLSLLEDPSRARSMGRKGREKAQQRFSWTATGACAEKALARAVNRPVGDDR